MPLGAALVIDAAVGNRPAMGHADIVFDDVVDLGPAQGLRQRADCSGGKLSSTPALPT